MYDKRLGKMTDGMDDERVMEILPTAVHHLTIMVWLKLDGYTCFFFPMVSGLCNYTFIKCVITKKKIL